MHMLLWHNDCSCAAGNDVCVAVLCCLLRMFAVLQNSLHVWNAIQLLS